MRWALSNRGDLNAGVSGLRRACPGERSFGEATAETNRLDGLLDLGCHQCAVIKQLDVTRQWRRPPNARCLDQSAQCRPDPLSMVLDGLDTHAEEFRCRARVKAPGEVMSQTLGVR